MENETDEFQKRPVVICVGWKLHQLKDDNEIQNCYKKCKTPKQVISHMRGVADFISSIKDSFSLENRNCHDWDL